MEPSSAQGAGMESAILTFIVLLALIVWRLAFAGLQLRLLRRESAAVSKQNDGVREQCFLRLQLPCAEVIAGTGWSPGSYRIDLIQADKRAETCLRAVAALIGATPKGNGYLLKVGTTRFEVHDRYVRRLRETTDPRAGYDETCFYTAFQGMPKAEQIASALLQLWNNPELFDRWANKDLAFKADGQLFGRA